MEKTKQQFSNRLEEVWDSKVTLSAHELETIIHMAYETRTKWTLCIVGESGIGKSMIPENYAKRKGLGFINIKGAGLLPEDIRGMGTLTKKIDESMLADSTLDAELRTACAVEAYVRSPSQYSFHLMPQLEEAFTPGWKGILFLDEFAQASREVQDVYFQIIYDRRIDEKVLSDDAIVLTAMNPPGLAEYALNPLTKAAEDRLEFYVYKPVYTEWCKWAEDNEIVPQLISFVRNNPSCYDDNKGRRLHNLSDRLKALDSAGITSQRITTAAAMACIGGGHAIQFTKFMAGVTINTSDILGFSSTVEDTIARIKTLSDDKRVSMLSSLNKELSTILSNREECIRTVRSAILTSKKASEASTTIVRPKSEKARICIDIRNSLGDETSDTDIINFTANIIMYYTNEMFEKNADLMVTFIRDVSGKSSSDLKASLNALMRKPEYSPIVNEVIRCQSATKTKSAEA